MEVIEMRVTLTPSEAAEVVRDKLAGGIVSAELLDSYNRRTADGKEVVVRLFERYYMRSSNRATLTLVADFSGGSTGARAKVSRRKRQTHWKRIRCNAKYAGHRPQVL